MQIILLFAALAYILALIAVANRLDGATQTAAAPARIAVTYPYTVDAPSQRPQPTASTPGQGGGNAVLLNLLLFIILGVLLLYSANVLLAGLFPEMAAEAELTVSLNNAIYVALVGLFAAALSSVLILWREVRVWLSGRLGSHGTFDPDSRVHMTALVLAIIFLSYTAMDLILVGGVAGLAENLAEQSPGAQDALGSLVIMIVVAFLGVGLLVRRSLTQVLERLALRLPTFQDIVWGVGTAGACLGLIFIFGIVMTFVLSPEALEQQGAASDQIARALGGSLLLVFLAAFGAAVGEEILFRGALQPVFGLIPTTLFFALLHTQYALTPGSAIIVIVGGAFGILKQRTSTTAAIIAHFTYNFVLLALAYVYIQLEEAGLLPEAAESIILLTSYLLPGLTQVGQYL